MDAPRDIFDVLGDSVAAEATSQPERTPPLDPIMLGDVTLVDAGSFAHSSCDGGRAPFGSGFSSGGEEFDWCSYCYVAELENPHRQPSGDEVARLARHGIGSTGVPLHVSIGEPVTDLALVGELAAQHGIERLVVFPNAGFTAWRDGGGKLADRVIVYPVGEAGRAQSCDPAGVQRMLSGTDEVPPLDPDLLARLDAAKDERGIIRDAGLADEYHLALIRQSEENDRRLGRSEPVIERGSVFPSAGDEGPLG